MKRDTWSTDPSVVTCRGCLKVASLSRDPDFEAERLRAALQRIKAECGHVCTNFELCTHVTCQSSVAAWMIADAALKSETPESANAKAAADRATLKEQP